VTSSRFGTFCTRTTRSSPAASVKSQSSSNRSRAERRVQRAVFSASNARVYLRLEPRSVDGSFVLRGGFFPGVSQERDLLVGAFSNKDRLDGLYLRVVLAGEAYLDNDPVTRRESFHLSVHLRSLPLPERGEFFLVEIQGSRGDVLLQVLDRRGTRDRKHYRGAPQEPRERHLPGRGVMAGGDLV
jgi:hypothetical protein